MNQKAKGQYQARLENQKSQLERHGNFAEVVIRTTPEGTDMINFARLWEHILVVADRQTRGYIAKNSREDFDKTRSDFNDSVEFMVGKIRDCVKRHQIDLSGSNFISRIAQRYEIVDRKRHEKVEAATPAPQAAAAPAATPAVAPVAAPQPQPQAAPAAPAARPAVVDDVDGF